MRSLQKQQGFTLVEVLVVIGLLAILGGAVLFNISGSDEGAKEATLKTNVTGLREAIALYYNDHGWYPCSPKDANKKGDPLTFQRQLTWYTNAAGEVSKKKTSDFRYGPYLKKFPEEPITGTADISIDTKREQILEELAKRVAKSSGKGGWYYEAKSGNLLPNLGKKYSEAYTQF